MNEKYVASLELCKRLKGLGVKQWSEWYWTNYYKNVIGSYLFKNSPTLVDYQVSKNNLSENGFYCYSAFHVGELGEMLPVESVKLSLSQKKCGNGFFIDLYRNESGIADEEKFIYQSKDDTEANARAKMLIYLIENKLILTGGKP